MFQMMLCGSSCSTSTWFVKCPARCFFFLACATVDATVSLLSFLDCPLWGYTDLTDFCAWSCLLLLRWAYLVSSNHFSENPLGFPTYDISRQLWIEIIWIYYLFFLPLARLLCESGKCGHHCLDLSSVSSMWSFILTSWLLDVSLSYLVLLRMVTFPWILTVTCVFIMKGC